MFGEGNGEAILRDYLPNYTPGATAEETGTQFSTLNSNNFIEPKEDTPSQKTDQSSPIDTNDQLLSDTESMLASLTTGNFAENLQYLFNSNDLEGYRENLGIIAKEYDNAATELEHYLNIKSRNDALTAQLNAITQEEQNLWQGTGSSLGEDTQRYKELLDATQELKQAQDELAPSLLAVQQALERSVVSGEQANEFGLDAGEIEDLANTFHDLWKEAGNVDQRLLDDAEAAVDAVLASYTNRMNLACGDDMKMNTVSHVSSNESTNLQKAVSDLLDALDKVKPEYQQYAQQAVMNAVLMHKMKQAMGGAR